MKRRTITDLAIKHAALAAVVCAAASTALALGPTSPHSIAWITYFRPNNILAHPPLIGVDANGSVYTYSNTTSTQGVYDRFDPYGAPIGEVLDKPGLNLNIQETTGTVNVLQSSPGFANTRTFYLSGIPDSFSELGTSVGSGYFASGDLAIAYADTTPKLLVTKKPLGGPGTTYVVSTTSPSAAYITPHYLLAVVASPSSSSQVVATIGSETLSKLWSRTFPNDTLALRTTVVNFCEDENKLIYVLINQNQFLPKITHTFTIICLDPNNINVDAWDYTGSGAASLISAEDSKHVYFSYNDGSSKLGMIVDGQLQWSITTPVQALVCGPYDNDKAWIAYYDSVHGNTNVSRISSAGAVLYSYTFPGSGTQDVGSFYFSESMDATYFSGESTANGGADFVCRLSETYGLSGLTLPHSVVGGKPLAGTLIANAPSSTPLSVQLVSSGPAVIGETTQLVGTTQQNISLVTQGVDVPTFIQVRAKEGLADAPTASTNVEPAIIASVAPAANSVVGGNTMTVTVNFDGKTGPSGRAVTVLSGNHAVVPVQGPLYVKPQVNSAQLTFLTNKVTVGATVTIGISDGTTQKNFPLTVTP